MLGMTLNIQNEFIDPRSGRTKMSNVRTTISGIQYTKIL